ncbi:MAG: hypothetical protein LBR77_06970 [Lachnospiraceae bacterium]|jgi:glucan-binding YG repeat protein|nr:hypothetical protein [Lachnospiraceae bacterium]
MVKRKLIGGVAVAALTATMAAAAAFSAFAGEWKHDANGWWYDNLNGTCQANGWFLDTTGKWYYFGHDGYMLENTFTPDGYKVGPTGAYDASVPKKTDDDAKDVPTGWVKDAKGWRFANENGTFKANEWVIGNDGKYYYLAGNSYMLTSAYAPDGRYVDATGAWTP